ncbi:MAG: acylneuraminate cytidylyltransferase family protein [Patescibacteria group bacterium]
MKSKIKKVDTIAIIPARGDSKSIPHKNIALFGGKPLIYYTIKAALDAKLLDAVIVSTDDPAIARVARKCGADVPFLRPKKYSGDAALDITFLQHAVNWLEKNRDWKPDIVLNLRPTGPLRTAEDIDEVISLMKKTKCDSVRTVSKWQLHTPFKMWYFNEGDQRIKPLLPTKQYKIVGTDVPRQQLPVVYWQNGLIDATRAKFIKKGRIYGADIRGLVIEATRVQDIDDLDDLVRVEKIMKQLKNPKK